MQKKSNQPTPNMKKDIVAKKHFGYKKTNFFFFCLNLKNSFFSDLRAKLEVTIDKVLNAIRLAKTFSRHNHGYTDEDEDDLSSNPTSDNEEVC